MIKNFKNKKFLGLIILIAGIVIASGILWHNLAYSLPPEQQPPYVSCSASPSSLNEGGVVTFTASPSNFTCEGSFSFTWSGTKAGTIGCASNSNSTCTTQPLYSSITIHSDYSASNPDTYDLGVTASCGSQSAFNFCTATVNHPLRSKLDVSVSGQGVVTHLACGANRICTRVSGAGADLCSPENAVCAHLECTGDESCTAVSGAGSNQCSSSSDCSVKSISVSLDPSTILVNGTSQASATSTYQNGSQSSITSQASWSSSNGSVATISSSGVITGRGAGTATIIARYGDSSRSATLSVLLCPAGETRPHKECSGSSCISVNTCGTDVCSGDVQCQW